MTTNLVELRIWGITQSAHQPVGKCWQWPLQILLSCQYRQWRISLTTTGWHVTQYIEPNRAPSCLLYIVQASPLLQPCVAQGCNRLLWVTMLPACCTWVVNGIQPYKSVNTVKRPALPLLYIFYYTISDGSKCSRGIPLIHRVLLNESIYHYSSFHGHTY